jgi:polyhydroxyalkanoate synthesis regulator phasin
MTSLRKRLVVGGVVAVVAGGGIAYAATTSTNPRDAYLNDVAKRLNVTPEKLRDAMKGASLDQLDQAVKDGKLTQEQADAMKQKIEAGGGAGPIIGKPGFFGGGPGPRGGPGFGGGHGFGGGGIAFKAVGGVLDDVAKQLGLSAADLRKQLASGKSIADLAKAQNKSLDDIKKTITDSAKSHHDQAVKDGDLTQKQADKVSTELAGHLDELVTAAPPKIIGPDLKRSFRGGPFKGGPGGPGGGPGRAFGLGFGPLGPDVDAVAKYLGLSASKLRDELASGKSLTDIAKAQNKDAAGLKKVVADRLQTRLDQAVKDGHLTKDQADAIAKKMTAHLDDLLDMSMPRFKHP